MKIRAVTLGLDLPAATDGTEPLRQAASFLDGTRAAFGAAGIDFLSLGRIPNDRADVVRGR